jgi:hypothetical protein
VARASVPRAVVRNDCTLCLHGTMNEATRVRGGGRRWWQDCVLLKVLGEHPTLALSLSGNPWHLWIGGSIIT